MIKTAKGKKVYSDFEQGKISAIKEFAERMQLIKLINNDDALKDGCVEVPADLILAIEYQISICACEVATHMLEEMGGDDDR